MCEKYAFIRVESLESILKFTKTWTSNIILSQSTICDIIWPTLRIYNFYGISILILFSQTYQPVIF